MSSIDHVQTPFAVQARERDTIGLRHMVECMADLSERDRNVIVWKFIEERETYEIATMLGVADGAVKSIVHRARKRLADLFHQK